MEHHSTSFEFTESGLIGPAVSSFVTIVGISFVETGGADPGFVRLRSGAADGPVIARYSGPTGQGCWPDGPPHVRCDKQVYVEVVSGTIEGNVFIR